MKYEEKNILWLNSPLKDKIFIGRHSLESSGAGAAHFNRYQNKYTGKYDGVHLYGQTGLLDYTNSVKNILMMSVPKHNPDNGPVELGTAQPDVHNDCAQAKYQRKEYHPTVQTKNRFSPLYQGNC